MLGEGRAVLAYRPDMHSVGRQLPLLPLGGLYPIARDGTVPALDLNELPPVMQRGLALRYMAQQLHTSVRTLYRVGIADKLYRHEEYLAIEWFRGGGGRGCLLRISKASVVALLEHITRPCNPE
jgi:hypothetical protein